jgi:hypothetical protein
MSTFNWKRAKHRAVPAEQAWPEVAIYVDGEDLVIRQRDRNHFDKNDTLVFIPLEFAERVARVIGEAASEGDQ